MQFVLTGFTPDKTFRVFAFDGVDADRLRTAFTVRVDLAVIRTYGIRMQDLPLLCRTLLERRDEASVAREFLFSETEMDVFAKEGQAARDASAQKRKTPRKPPSENTGSAWRVPVLN